MNNKFILESVKQERKMAGHLLASANARQKEHDNLVNKLPNETNTKSSVKKTSSKPKK